MWTALSWRRGAAAWVLVVLSACGGGSGEGLDENGRPVVPASPAPPAVLEPTLSSIQEKVFSVNCAISGCHGGAAAQFGLRLDPGFSAGNLINVASGQDARLTRVIPGNPDASLLIKKLEGTQTVGDRMPQFGPYLPQATIDVIRHWILDGALP